MAGLETITDEMRKLGSNADADDFSEPVDVAKSKIMREARKLPDGRKTADLSDDEFAAALAELGIPGVAKTNTHEANQACYAVFLCALRDQGADDAVSVWRFMSDSEGTGDDETEKPDERKNDGEE